jgi:hypothetical protein
MKGNNSKNVGRHGMIGGIYHGSGLPAKTGKRKGTFTIDQNAIKKAKKGLPPLKMN